MTFAEIDYEFEVAEEGGYLVSGCVSEGDTFDFGFIK